MQVVDAPLEAVDLVPSRLAIAAPRAPSFAVEEEMPRSSVPCDCPAERRSGGRGGEQREQRHGVAQADRR